MKANHIIFNIPSLYKFLYQEYADAIWGICDDLGGWVNV